MEPYCAGCYEADYIIERFQHLETILEAALLENLLPSTLDLIQRAAACYAAYGGWWVFADFVEDPTDENLELVPWHGRLDVGILIELLRPTTQATRKLIFALAVP